MSQTDLEYYTRRREEELIRAATAGSPEVASAHRMLGQIYASEVTRLGGASRRPDGSIRGLRAVGTV